MDASFLYLLSVIDYTEVTAITERNAVLRRHNTITGKPSAVNTERETVKTSAWRTNICLTPHKKNSQLCLCLSSQCGTSTDCLCPPFPLLFCLSSFLLTCFFPVPPPVSSYSCCLAWCLPSDVMGWCWLLYPWDWPDYWNYTCVWIV